MTKTSVTVSALQKLAQILATELADTSDYCVHFMKKYPEFIFLGSGMARAVYIHKDYPDYVFKIEKGSNARDCYGGNRNEWNRFKKIPKELQRYFAKPVAISSDYCVMVMKRVKGKTLADTNNGYWYIDQRIREIKNKVADIRHSLDIDDLHGNNIMVSRNGRLKIVDYAG